MDDFKKACGRCREPKLCSFDKSRSEFHRNLGTGDGFQHKCKKCQTAENKDYRQRVRKAHLEALAAAGMARKPPPPQALPEFEITVQELAQAPSPPPPVLLAEAPPPPPPVVVPPEVSAAEQTREQLQVARLKLDNQRLKDQVKNYERLALSGDAMRELLGTLDSPNVTPSPEWLNGASAPRSVTGTAVLFISDIHFDEVVSASQIGGANAYDREIATQSIKNTFRSAIVLLKAFMASPKYDGIVCPLGGDLLSGNIHEELQLTNEAPIQQSMIALEELLIEGLGGLADEFGKVHVPCVVGNHGRMTRKPQAKNRAFESFEWPIYQRIAAYFRGDPRLTFDIPDGPDAFFSIYQKRFCLTHGDAFRGGDGVGGILVPIRRGLSRKQFRQNALGDPFDTMLIGHWHQYVHMSDLVVNGSIKGYDEYASQNNFAFEPPQQALFVVHPEIGVTARWPVLCRYQGGKVKALK